MSVEQIKSSLALLSPTEQSEVSAFLFHLRHASDPDYQERVASRLSDKDRSHWLTPEEFERQLDRK
jgi:asparagine synthetase B (glutamine-hydrolysing)